jgi:hypothetical protein
MDGRLELSKGGAWEVFKNKVIKKIHGPKKQDVIK